MINLIIKDLKNIIYDRKVLALLLIMPIVLMTILGFSLKGVFSSESGSGIGEVTIAIVKQYHFEEEMRRAKGELESYVDIAENDNINFENLNPETLFFESFLGAEGLEFLHYEIMSYEAAIEQMEKNRITGIVILPEDYIYNSIASMTFSTRNKTSIIFEKNENKGFMANIIEDILLSYTDIVNGIVAQKNVQVSLALTNELEKLSFSEEMMVTPDNSQIKVIAKSVSGEEGLNSFQYYTVAIMTMFLLYAAAQGGKVLLEEKQNFTAQRLEASGVGIAKTATANMIVIILITILQTIITIIYSTIVLKVHWGSLTTVGVGMLFTGFSIGGIGMFVSVLTYISNRPPVANIFETVILQFMALVGGSFIPVNTLPKALQKLQGLSANGNALKLYLNGMSYRPLHESYPYLINLVMIGGIMMLASYGLLYIYKGRVKI